MTELRTIVVGVDFSAASLAMSRWVARHLTSDAAVVLLHCLELPAPGSLLWETLPPRDELEPRLRQRAEERLAALVAEIGREKVEAVVASGHPSDEIASLALKREADLVVAGKHGGHHGLGQVLGSTAERLVASWHRPVLLARHLPPGPLHNILVPVDASGAAARALEWGVTLGRRHGARVIACHVVTEWYYQRVRELDSEDQARHVQEKVMARARSWLEDFLTQNAPNEAVTPHLVSGQPGFQTLGAVESYHADLVVVGNHGLKSLLGDPLARLSRFLIMASPTSVFVVPKE